MSNLTDRLRRIAKDNGDAKWAEELDDAIDELREAADEIERLTVIVDRLPKTADGVPMQDGMRVWSRLDLTEDVVTLKCTGVSRHRKGSEFVDGWWYSTREAAKKARGSA